MMTSVRKSSSYILFIAAALFTINQFFFNKEIILSGQTMGTTYSIKYIPKKFSIKKFNQNKIDKILGEINRQMSTYIVDSEISNFNSFSDTLWFGISPEFAEVVKASFEYNQLSNGLYDITVMPLVNLWGFGPEVYLNRPSQEMIDEKLEFVGQDLLEIDGNRIRKKHPKLQIDLSSIAKGYAVDRLIESLSYKDIMIEIGGEIRTKSYKKDWKIGIVSPSLQSSQNDIEEVISLNNLSIATSGNYRNYFIDEFQSFFHHGINPKTGYPITANLGSVSILSEKSCMDADALATMVFAMSNSEDLENFLESKSINSMLIFLTKDGTYKKSFTGSLIKNN
jgi:thiamine biosynthesis lipoprotein